MVSAQKMKPIGWDTDILAALYRPDLSPMGPLASADEMFNGCHLYEYEKGKQHALVAVKPLTFSAGNRLHIVGLSSDGERLQAHDFYAALDDLGRSHNARIVSLLTAVPHVAKSCLQNGYRISGAAMIKVLDAS